VPDGVWAAYEIVINGMDEASVKSAMKAGIVAAAGMRSVMFIGALNFGGKLGQYRLSLYELFQR